MTGSTAARSAELRLLDRAVRARSPEVLVFGLNDANAGALIDDVAARVRAGSDLTVGEVVSFPGWAHRVPGTFRA